MSQENKRIVEEINNAFIEGNTEGFLKHCADDAKWVMEGGATTTGVSAIREFMSQMEGHEPPKFTVNKLIGEGDSVICYGEMTMEGPAEHAGKYSYCDAYTFANGKVTELRSFVVKHKTEGEKSGSAAS